MVQCSQIIDTILNLLYIKFKTVNIHTHVHKQADSQAGR